MLLRKVVQFQRRFRNWNSHSRKPRLMPLMISFRSAESCRQISAILPRRRRVFLHIKYGSSKILEPSALDFYFHYNNQVFVGWLVGWLRLGGREENCWVMKINEKKSLLIKFFILDMFVNGNCCPLNIWKGAGEFSFLFSFLLFWFLKSEMFIFIISLGCLISTLI